LNHLELDVEVGVRLVRDGHGQSLGVTNSDSTKVKVLRADLDHTIGTSTDDLNALGRSRRLLHHAKGTGVVHVGHLETRSWREESNSVLDVFKQTLAEERDRNVVLLATDGSEDSLDLGVLVRHQDGSLRLKLDLVSVLLGHAPFILDRDARLILDWELLLGGDTNVTGREEDRWVDKSHLRAITVALKHDLLHVCRRVVEQELGREVIETRRLGVELKADQGERLACDLANRRVRFEITRGVLHDAVLNRGITCVVKLDGLVDRLIGAARRELRLRVAHLDHGNEGLGARGERMT